MLLPGWRDRCSRIVQIEEQVERLQEACKAAYRCISGDHADGGPWRSDREVIDLLQDTIKKESLS